MTYDLRNIMTSAWKLVRMTNKTIGQALKTAWATAKANAKTAALFVVAGIKATPAQQRSLAAAAELARQQGIVTRTVMTGGHFGGVTQALGQDLQDVYFWAAMGQPEDTVLPFTVNGKAFTLSQTDVRSYKTTMVVKPA